MPARLRRKGTGDLPQLGFSAIAHSIDQVFDGLHPHNHRGERQSITSATFEMKGGASILFMTPFYIPFHNSKLSRISKKQSLNPLPYAVSLASRGPPVPPTVRPGAQPTRLSAPSQPETAGGCGGPHENTVSFIPISSPKHHATPHHTSPGNHNHPAPST